MHELNSGVEVLPYRHILALVFALLFVVGAPVEASAQQDAEQAVQIAQKAAEDFKAERFLDAAKKFEQAFELYPDATLLKNQAVAYYKADVCAKALESAKAYRTFVASRDNVPEKDKRDVAKVTVECEYDAAVRYIETREFALAQASIDDARAAGPATQMMEKIDSLQADLDAAIAAPEDTDEPDPVIVDSDTSGSDDGSILPIIGWSVVGVGAAVGIVTGILHYSAFSKASDGKDVCDSLNLNSDQCARQQADAYRDWSDGADTISGLTPLYIVSGVVTAAGVGILVYHYATDEEETVTLLPAIGRDHAGFQLDVRF